MVEQDTKAVASTNWQEQKRNKPSIENCIRGIITDDDLKKSALDFVAHLRKKNYGIVWSRANEWWVTLYCQAKCKIGLRSDEWANDGLLCECTWVIDTCLSHTSEYDETATSKSSQSTALHYDPDETTLKVIKDTLEAHKKAEVVRAKNTPSMFQQQKAIKPLIEDIIPKYLLGDMRHNALDLATWLRASKLTPAWTLTNWWNVNCKGKPICKIHLGEDVWTNSKSWFVHLRLSYMHEYEDSIANANLQSIIWDNIKYCTSCGGCAPGRDVTLYGKECKGLCFAPHLTICEPDAAEIEAIKKLIELEKKARLHYAAKNKL